MRPRPLKPGDRLAVCAPAGPVHPGRLQEGVAALRGLGFDVQVGEGVLAGRRFTAGTVDRRVQELHDLFADDAVAGVICARGGAGASSLLARLDQEVFRAHPKVFVGYSDATALHLFLQRLGLVTFHGPMVARELADGSFDRASLFIALTGEGAPYASAPDDLLALRPGLAEGRLRGGCLSLLAAACGTPWQLRAGGEPTILFMEDVDEPPYRIDRMLRQLRDARVFEGVTGVVFGDMKGCSPPVDADWGLQDVLLEALDGLEAPVALGLSSGHTSSPFVTLPLGVRARLECTADEARFALLEPAVG
jgi:muramoyltetrapeptide carboxypeptidase